MTLPLGRYGVFDSTTLMTPELARHAETLGFGAVWVGSSPPGDLIGVEALLDATENLVVATGIVNIWTDDAATLARSYRRVQEAHPDRLLLGIGVGHREANGDYQKPLAALASYLDVLDDGGVPVDRRVIAALGPRALELARDRTAGSHPYLVPVAHTRSARTILGPDALLAPVQNVVLGLDVDRGRDLARPAVRGYLTLDNYLANFRRLGYTDADLAGTGSERFLDDMTAYGDESAVTARLDEHIEAGADHVAVRLLPRPESNLFEGYEELAALLYS